MNKLAWVFILVVLMGGSLRSQVHIPDANLYICLDEIHEIVCPNEGERFFGQDANYSFFPPSLQDNGDGTVTDHNTELMWQQGFTRMAFIDYTDFQNRTNEYLEEVNESGSLAGYSDWRVPSLKEILSIADLNGNVTESVPYIQDDIFEFEYPSDNNNINDPPGTRKIDAQYVSSTKYVGLVNNRDEGFMSFNFADGHVKTYRYSGRTVDTSGFYIRLVRGDSNYGINDFVDNGDGTISDIRHGLMWQKSDDGLKRNWEQAMEYCENLDLAGFKDWHLPDVKELNSILDLSRNDPALNTEVFEISDKDAWYWTSTSYLDRKDFGIYICFGKATNTRGVDTHGAGAMRGDPKSGDPGDYPNGSGPQMDEVRINNLVRAVRIIESATSVNGNRGQPEISLSVRPNPNNGHFELKVNDMSLDQRIIKIEVYDACGNMIDFENCEIETIDDYIHLEVNTKGILFLKLFVDDRVLTTKILVL